MSYYKECEYCKGTLDPGERCQCKGARLARLEDVGTNDDDAETPQERSA